MRAPLGLLLSALILGGCAKFPESGADNSATHLIFRFKMAAPINPNCRYIVAIRTLQPTTGTPATDPLNADPNRGPIPVADVGSKNGFVAGSPTNFVEYNEGLAERYQISRFATKAEAPDPSDDNPINLGAITQTGVVYLTNNVDPRPSANGGASYGDTLGFELDLRDLTLNDATARTAVAIQFNILAMSYAVGAGNTGDRVMDALGNQRTTTTFNAFVNNVSLLSSRIYRDADRGGDEELENDTFSINGRTLPSVDIVDWTLEVRRP